METARSKFNLQYLFRNSPKGLLAIIDGCRDAIFITDTDSTFVEVNKAAEELTGYERVELLNMTIPDLHDEADRVAYKEYFNRILEGEEVTSEAIVRRKDGTYVDTEFSNRRICVQGIFFVHSIARDITSRRKAEKDLKESEERFRSIFENSIIGIAATSSEGKIISVNNAFARMYGYDSPEQLLNESPAASQLYANPSKRAEILKKIKKNGFIGEVETEVRKRDGTQFFVLASAREISDPEGKFNYILSTHIDITERVKAAIRINDAAIYSRNLIESSLDPLLTIDHEGKISDVNFMMENITGVKREKLIGSDFSGYFTEPEKAREGYQLVFSKSSVRDFPLTVIHLNGDRVDVLFNATLFRDAAGKVQGIFASARDVTELRKMEAELRESKERLELLNQRMSEISEKERAAISREIHDDLGQALTAMKLELNKIHHHLNDNPTALNDLARVNSLVTGTIRDVQRISVELRSGILDDLGLQAAFEWYTGEFERRSNIKCQLEITNYDLKNNTLNLALYRILQEALTNVIRHSHATVVKVAVKQTMKKLTMKIMDNGVGIPGEKIRSPRSLGLGNMRERVRQFNGIIEFESSPEKGTLITITLPLE